jgi:hypothetical protein
LRTQREFIPHSSPLRPNLGEYGRLIDVISEDLSDIPRIPRHVREGTKKIVKLLTTYYPTQGRRRTAIVVVAMAIARGNRNLNEFQDLLHRVKYFLGEEIPKGQLKNTFEDLSAFLKNLKIYKLNRRQSFKLTQQEKNVSIRENISQNLRMFLPFRDLYVYFIG